jgi:hypothetical protein
MRLIYLASPYSHPRPEVQRQRFEAVCRQAASMMGSGEFVFSPIAHTHPISGWGLPGDWSFWQSYDRAILSRCDELAVLKLPGWKESTGVAAEIAIAEEFGLAVRFIEPQEHNTLLNNDLEEKI